MSNKLTHFKVGKIVNTQGLKGEVRVYPFTDDINRFDELDVFYLDKDFNTKWNVERVRYKGNLVIMKIKDIDSIEKAERLRDKFIYVSREDGRELEEEEYFIADMIGLDVFTVDGEKVGVFQLVIMNLGMSIYEKFKDENCPNPIISDKMKELSKQYTHKGFLKKKEFEEETLWTLYSLQDGVTSVSPEKYKNRGNGSLRFIESFYNLKGCNASKLSKMTLQSGKANIVFDGKYPVTESMVKGEKYRVLTFNSSGNIEDKPDNKYVKCSEFFFPGTFIHAYIYL